MVCTSCTYDDEIPTPIIYSTGPDGNMKKVAPKSKKIGYGFSCPISGRVSMRFDKLKCEGGVIIESRSGEDVLSAMGGKVIYVGTALTTYGNVVIIEHDNRIVTMYAKLGDARVKVGSYVETGEKIADARDVGDKYSVCFVPKHNDEYIKNLTRNVTCR